VRWSLSKQKVSITQQLCLVGSISGSSYISRLIRSKQEQISGADGCFLLLTTVPASSSQVCGTTCVTRAGSGVTTRAAGTQRTGHGAFWITLSISEPKTWLLPNNDP
jgi:hypothetical protein